MALSYCGFLELRCYMTGESSRISLVCSGDGDIEIMVTEIGNFRIKIREEVEDKIALKT